MSEYKDPPFMDVFRRKEEQDADITAGPHGWIQWKGTEVCMDIHCACGEHSHVDAEFAYYVKCPKCGQIWAMGSNVRMMAVTAEEIAGGCEPVEAS